MTVNCTGIAKVKILATGEVVEISANELDWEETADERNMGPEVHHEAIYEVESATTGESYTITWGLWEYPQGAPNHQKTEPGEGLELLQDFSYDLEHSPEE